jgi:hypothetical protein
MAFDSSHGVTNLFGGEVTPDSQSTAFGDTWLFDGNQWTEGPSGPSARWSHAMAFDSTRNFTVLFAATMEAAPSQIHGSLME